MAGISTANQAFFKSARAVWPVGRREEMNLSVGFCAVLPLASDEPVVLHVAASSLYRLSVNGEFVGHGPARGPHGYCRVDRWDITDMLTAERNVIAVEVASYNLVSYYLLDTPAFCRAEIVAGDEVLASTAGEGEQFAAVVLDYRVQKIERFSWQRCFMEAYRLSPGYDDWLRDATTTLPACECEVVPDDDTAIKLLPRGVAYPDFEIVSPTDEIFRGGVKTIPLPDEPWRPNCLTQVGDTINGYSEDKLEFSASQEIQQIENTSKESLNRKLYSEPAIKLPADSYSIVRFERNLSGFIGAKITCEQPTRLFFVFDEILTDDDIDYKRLTCVSVVTFDLAPGSYSLETIEPYTLGFLKIIAVGGGCDIERVYLRRYANGEMGRANFTSPDEQLNGIFAAAQETFSQNAIDLFMDCPSRERAGWLADSFFTARVAWDLTGNTTIERNMYENYLLPGKFPHLVEGMLPMCYPGDDMRGEYIPSWAMWFVIQLEEYLDRSGDREIVDALCPRVLALLDFLAAYKNSDGLLEKLDGWNFVEWSKANDFVQDVNYPINMLYAGTLDATGRLYGMAVLVEQAEAIRQTICDQSDGEFFVDNAIRADDGALEVTRNRSEACQYFAFYFGVASPQTHAKLWETLVNEFGPKREQTGAFADVHPSAPFFGNQLRLELLSRYGLTAGIPGEVKGYLLSMAESTGTLWEHANTQASCNHGFASHAARVLYRDVLGVYKVDGPNRKVTLRFCDSLLEACSGSVPVGDSDVELSWQRQGGALSYKLSMPPGFDVEVQNLTNLELRREG